MGHASPRVFIEKRQRNRDAAFNNWRILMSSIAQPGRAPIAPKTITGDERKVIFASSLGTVFEWYDFYLYGSLAAIIGKQFFSGLDPSAAFIASLLAFAAGFFVRPFGAIVFGRIGDL